jgi:hypothetical protein
MRDDLEYTVAENNDRLTAAPPYNDITLVEFDDKSTLCPYLHY